MGSRRNKTEAGRIAHKLRAIFAENLASAMKVFAPAALTEADKIRYLLPLTDLSRSQLQRYLKAPTDADFQAPTLDNLAALARAFDTDASTMIRDGAKFTRDAAVEIETTERDTAPREPGREALQRPPSRAPARSRRPVT